MMTHYEIKRLKQQLEEKEIELLASPTNGALLIIAKAYEGYKKEKPKATQGDFFNKVVADSSIRGLSIGTFNNLIKEGNKLLTEAIRTSEKRNN